MAAQTHLKLGEVSAESGTNKRIFSFDKFLLEA